MNEARFVVCDVFDLAGRGGLLARGVLEQGVVKIGDTLREVETGQHIRVIGMEFHTSPSLGEHSYTLVLERASDLQLQPGSTLEAVPESS